MLKAAAQLALQHAKSSSGRPPASASLGKLAGMHMFWLAGHNCLAFHVGADHAAWLADGTLPAEKLRFPDKVGLSLAPRLGLSPSPYSNPSQALDQTPSPSPSSSPNPRHPTPVS